MKKNKIFPLSLILIICLAGGIYIYKSLTPEYVPNSSADTFVTENDCLADDCLKVDGLNYPVQELPANVKMSLEKAIDDEYKALSVYESVIKKFGMVRPFSMIKGAEEQHIASLKSLFDKYGLAVPTNKWIDKINSPETLQKACQAGVEAEIANAALYDNNLLPSVVDYEDITFVFNNLSNASKLKHLVAFEKCN